MKRTCLQENTNTDEQSRWLLGSCEFPACRTGWHPVEILFKEQYFDPKEIQQVKSFVRMKNNSILLVVISIIALYSLGACNKDDFKGDLTNDEAKSLITEWVFKDYLPQMNPSLVFSIEEITTKEIWNKMHAQIFNVVCEVPGLGNRALFIKNRKVFDLGRFNLYGADRLENLLATDLDNDNIYEICYTLKHGSGIIRTNMYCYINELNDKLLCLNMVFFYTDSELKLVKRNDQDVFVKKVINNRSIDIGNIKLVNEKNVLEFKLIK